MATYDVNGKVALVTGGGSGIGEACAVTLAGSGAKVVVADVNPYAAKRVAAAIGDSAYAVVADVRDPDSVEAMTGVTVERFGALHIAVNNAGIGGPPGVSAAEYPIDAWRQLMSVNLDGVFYCIRAEIPRLLAAGGGSIVNLASVYGAVGSGLGIAYVAAKHGVVGLTRGMALEYAPAKIRVNAVGPGFIRTPMVEPYLDEAMIAQLNALHPLGRMGTAQEVAALVAWLASDAASFATGGYYPIDGGYLAQ